MAPRRVHDRLQNETRLWDDDYHGWWDDAVKGNSAPEWRKHEEVATLDGQPAVSMFFDLDKLDDTNSSVWHWSGTFQNGCSTLLCMRTSASGMLAGCSSGNRFARVVLHNILECASPAQLPAPVETRQYVDEFSTMSVANSEVPSAVSPWSCETP